MTSSINRSHQTPPSSTRSVRNTIETPVATIRFSPGGGDSSDTDSGDEEYLLNSGLPGYHPKSYLPPNESLHPDDHSTSSSTDVAGQSQARHTETKGSQYDHQVNIDKSKETLEEAVVQDNVHPNDTNMNSVQKSGHNLNNSYECDEANSLNCETASDEQKPLNKNLDLCINKAEAANGSDKSPSSTGLQNHDGTDKSFSSAPDMLIAGNGSPNNRTGTISPGSGNDSVSRFNPFDKLSADELQEGIEGSVFESCSPADSSSDFKTCTERSNSTDSWSDIMPRFRSKLRDHDSHQGRADISNAELGLAEDHFGRPEGHFGLSTIEELEMAIQNCKVLIFDAPEHSERRKNLVNKLVQLRMRLQEAKEGPEVVEEDTKHVVGHRFKKKLSNSSKHYCEQCTSVIWGVIQNWHRCTECSYTCHEKCLNSITRTCACVRVAENPTYILSICPEKGLAAQNYRCLECRAPISYKSGYGEPRQCDYAGGYYCERCHWNDPMIIPARVLHNYDLEPRKVCRASKQFLRLMWHRPVLRIQDVNPMLFNFVEELNDIKKLREEILIMKKYFLSCQAALESKLLLQLQERQHFVENSDMYSLQDLNDVAADTLLPELAKIHASFAQHIKTDCQLCQAKGYICELCDQQEVLFPFDNIAIVCSQCSTVLHRHCFIRRNQKCPKCERRQKSILEEGVDKVP